jgi:hypothetical protein
LLATAVLPLAFIPLANYEAVAPWGTALLLMGEGVLALAGFLAFLFVLGSPGMCVFARDRWALGRLVVLSLVYLTALLGGMWLGAEIRRDAFRRLAARSAPLVAAIKAFETLHGRPPESLAELTPDALPTEPWTGMGACPRYRYEQGSAAAKRFHGNPWALFVPVPSSGIGFDMFLYYPQQNYPRTGHGGWLEPLGAWAYVHE